MIAESESLTIPGKKCGSEERNWTSICEYVTFRLTSHDIVKRRRRELCFHYAADLWCSLDELCPANGLLSATDARTCVPIVCISGFVAKLFRPRTVDDCGSLAHARTRRVFLSRENRTRTRLFRGSL